MHWNWHLLMVAAAVAAAMIASVAGDLMEECANATRGTFISSTKGCTFYIFCNGENSIDGECSGNDYFNEEEQMCDDPSRVDCALAPVTPTPTRIPITITTPTAASVTNATKFVTVTTTIATSPSASSPPTLVPTSDSSLTTVESSVAEETTPTAVIGTRCPPFDDPNQLMFLAHPKSCSDYYVCYHGVAIPMHCSSMLHFNAHSGKCDYPENVKCQAHFSTLKEQCQPHTVDLFPHLSNCNYFYYCKNGYLLVQQCPFLFGWDYLKRACVKLDRAKCFNQRQQTST